MPRTPIAIYEQLLDDIEGIQWEGEQVRVSTCQRVILIGFESAEELTIDSESAELYQKYLEEYSGEEAFRYLVKVTAGIDSYVVGETQVTHQIKQAYISAKREEVLSSELDSIFQDIFKVASRIQTTTGVTKGKVSVLSLMEERIRQFIEQREFGVVAGIVGTGEMAKKSEKLLKRINKKIRITWFTDRNDIGDRVAYRKDNFPRKLQQFDVIFLAAHGLPEFIDSMKSVKHQQLYVDLTMPRTIESDVKTHHEVLSIEDLEKEATNNLIERQQSIQTADTIIEKYLLVRRRKEILRKHQDKVVGFRKKLLELGKKRKQELFDKMPTCESDLERRLDLAIKSVVHHAQQEFEDLLVEVYR